jgi:hypothetical protein
MWSQASLSPALSLSFPICLTHLPSHLLSGSLEFRLGAAVSGLKVFLDFNLGPHFWSSPQVPEEDLHLKLKMSTQYLLHSEDPLVMERECLKCRTNHLTRADLTCPSYH